MELKEYKPSNLGEVEVAIDGWRMGDYPSRMVAEMLYDEPDDEFLNSLDTDTANVFRDVFETHGIEVLTLLELWCGYVIASESEETEPTVSDFIEATYHALSQ